MSNKQQASTAHDSILASIGAVVTAVPEGKEPFAVAFPLPESTTDELTKDTSITFPLVHWRGEMPPRFGQVVKLECIERYAKGWRARTAEPVTPISSKQQEGVGK